jgi:hypothetical protein
VPDLINASQSTRKSSATVAERRAKRRSKWTVYEGMSADVESLGGTAAIVTGPRGGLYVEYEEDGTFHAVPIECVSALNLLQDPSAKKSAPAPAKK